jgi:uncharacterized membrane protein
VNTRIRKIAVTGVLAALSIVLGLTGLGFITWFPGASLTIMHVPVIIGAILEGPLVGALIGLLFGVFSMIQASISAVNPADLAFVNPIISVLPRVFIGPAAWVVYALIAGRPARLVRESIALIMGTIVGSLVNTVLVMGALGLFKVLPWSAIWVIASTNGILEAGFSAIIVFAVLSVWKHLPLYGGRSRLNR